MTADLYEIAIVAIFLPLYVTTFVGIGLVLRLRRSHPRACWFAIGAGAAIFLNWAVISAMRFGSEAINAWATSVGIDAFVVFLVLNGVVSALQTTAAALLVAAIVAGRRPEP